jgi:predicted cobalt transporter CbtA
MTARALLVRGMLVGAAAGLVAFLFATAFGAGPVEQAIAFEAAHTTEDGGHQVVSRGVQATLGLATGSVLYSVALGGIFGLAYAIAYGRLGPLGPRATAGVVALLGFVTVALIPALKYPANPPATGNPDTLQQRTVLFWLMIVISVAAGLLGVLLARTLIPTWGVWNAVTAAALAYLLIIAVADLPLPTFDEVPDGFPASLLWQFRLASIGTQLAVWATLGLLFGALTERAANRAAGRAADRAAVR